MVTPSDSMRWHITFTLQDSSSGGDATTFCSHIKTRRKQEARQGQGSGEDDDDEDVIFHVTRCLVRACMCVCVYQSVCRNLWAGCLAAVSLHKYKCVCVIWVCVTHPCRGCVCEGYTACVPYSLWAPWAAHAVDWEHTGPVCSPHSPTTHTSRERCTMTAINNVYSFLITFLTKYLQNIILYYLKI